MNSLVHQAQHLELNLFFYGQPGKLTKDIRDICYCSASCSVVCSVSQGGL